MHKYSKIISIFLLLSDAKLLAKVCFSDETCYIGTERSGFRVTLVNISIDVQESKICLQSNESCFAKTQVQRQNLF